MSHRHPPSPAADSGADQHPDDFFEDHYSSHPEPVEQFFEADMPTRRRTRRPSKARQRRRRRRTIVMIVVVLGFIGVVLAVAMFLRDLLGVDEVTDYAGPGTGSVTFTVEEGAAQLVVGNALEQQDIVADANEFVRALTSVSDGRIIQPGDYELKYQMSSEEAAEALLEEDAGVHYVPIQQGLRQNEVFDILAESTGIPREEFEALAEDPTQFGIPEQAPSLEGYLHPGEYRFALETTAAEVVQEMVGNTMAALETAGVTDAAEQYRILTVASIVQAEAGQADYGSVAGAIMNRLGPDNTETNGLIQSDATVTYGLGRKSYDLTDEEKADESNPYNTYAIPGLPVGPIGSPSDEAIAAAVNPEDVPFFYWVTVNLDTGETKFSETLAEHAGYVDEYQTWCSNNAGRCE